MKILQIGATFVGAQKKIEYAIHSYLREQGHDSSILYAIGESSDPFIIRYENRFDSLVRRALRKLLGKHPRFALLSTLKLIAQIKKQSPDLIHVHIIHHGYLDYQLLLNYIAKKKIPVVFTAHDMWFFTGGCYYYSEIACERFKTGCIDCPHSANKLDCKISSTEKNLKKKLALFEKLSQVGFVSVSPWVHSEMKKSALASYPQYTVMNSLDKVDILPVSKIKREKFTVIGVAANWDDRKGLSRFYELGYAVKDLCDIILVGSVDESRKADAPQNITFYGYAKSADELYDLYASCDLHVSMSFEETFGLTFVEAALCGIRSIGFDSTAIPVVLEKTHGYVISPCSVEGVAQKIRQLADDRPSCTVNEKELAEIKEYFSSERMALEYQRVYEEIFALHDKNQGV